MKAREFWLLGQDLISDTCIVHLEKPEATIAHACIHVREVVPIDWAKVWVGFENWNRNDYVVSIREKIQKLVEKAIAGGE